MEFWKAGKGRLLKFGGGGGRVGLLFFFVRPFVLKLLLSATHFYAPSQPPGEKAAIK